MAVDRVLLPDRKRIAAAGEICYTDSMNFILSVKRVSKQNKGKKCSCVLAYNFAEK